MGEEGQRLGELWKVLWPGGRWNSWNTTRELPDLSMVRLWTLMFC